MVIEFVSLYLGLLIGIQPVEVTVGMDVATVEIVLDDEIVAHLSHPPWRARVDFGDRLAPRRLVAIARDAAGTALGEATQLLNVARPTAEAGLVLERMDGRVTGARLTWQSVAADRPLTVRATLDGEPLPVDDPAFIPIPDRDPSSFHLLVVDLTFSPRQHIQVVASFGGAHGTETNTELTAIPVRLTSRRLPPLAALSVVVQPTATPLPVRSAEKGHAEIVFVRDHAADRIIERIGMRDARGVGSTGISSGAEGAEPRVTGIAASPRDALRRLLTIDSDDQVRMIWPATQKVEREEVRMELFPASPVFDARDGGIFWALTQDVVLSDTRDHQRLADAVAVAGVAATANNRRRAVVLVLGPEPDDASRFPAPMVRDFLRSLSVPLYIWTVSDASVSHSRPDPVPQTWCCAEGHAEIHSLQDLRRAVRQLEKDLAAQRILWVAGRHLPQEISIEETSGIRALFD